MSSFEHLLKAGLQRAISDLRIAFLAARHGALLLLAKLDELAQLQRLAVLWVTGSIALIFANFVCFQLGLNFASTAFVFLIMIVVLSLLDSFVSSAIFSAIAVGCLNFFFVEPRYTLVVGDVQDLITLTAFLVTSLAVTGLVRQLHSSGKARSEQARLLDLTTDAVFVRDREGVITYWNRGAEHLYGWKREEAVGKVTHHLLQTVFPGPLAEITETLSRAGRWEGELLHTTREGTQVSVASRWSLQRDERGSPIGTLESNTDITERKRAEDALRRSQTAYVTEAQELSHAGSFGWNVSNGEIFWSEETFRIFGYAPTTDVSIETLLDRVHPDDRALVRSVIERAATHREAFDIEHRLLMPDGSVRHLHVVAHALVDEPHNRQFAGAVMDVTARKETEQALRQSEKRYQDLFQAMAVSFWEVDYTRSRQMLRAVRDAGVVDFRRYFRENPTFVRDLMRATRVVNVNDHTVALFGQGSKEDLLTSIVPFWPDESLQDYAEAVLVPGITSR